MLEGLAAVVSFVHRVWNWIPLRQTRPTYIRHTLVYINGKCIKFILMFSVLRKSYSLKLKQAAEIDKSPMWCLTKPS